MFAGHNTNCEGYQPHASGLYQSWGVQTLELNYRVMFLTPVSFWNSKGPPPFWVPKVKLKGATLTLANFFPLHIQLSPIALLPACLTGDPSLIREYPECRMWKKVFLIEITKEGENLEFSVRAQTQVLLIMFNLLEILRSKQDTECLSHMPMPLISKCGSQF